MVQAYDERIDRRKGEIKRGNQKWMNQYQTDKDIDMMVKRIDDLDFDIRTTRDPKAKAGLIAARAQAESALFGNVGSAYRDNRLADTAMGRQQTDMELAKAASEANAIKLVGDQQKAAMKMMQENRKDSFKQAYDTARLGQYERGLNIDEQDLASNLNRRSEQSFLDLENMYMKQRDQDRQERALSAQLTSPETVTSVHNKARQILAAGGDPELELSPDEYRMLIESQGGK